MSVCLLLRSSVSVSLHVLFCLNLYSGGSTILYPFCLQSGLWLVGQSVTVFPITRSSGSLVYIMAVLLSVFVYAYYTKLNSLIYIYIYAYAFLTEVPHAASLQLNNKIYYKKYTRQSANSSCKMRARYRHVPPVIEMEQKSPPLTPTQKIQKRLGACPQ